MLKRKIVGLALVLAIAFGVTGIYMVSAADQLEHSPHFDFEVVRPMDLGQYGGD